MAVRTGEQFLQGLRDGREVWLEGERVADVTSHPKLTPRVCGSRRKEPGDAGSIFR